MSVRNCSLPRNKGRCACVHRAVTWIFYFFLFCQGDEHCSHWKNENGRACPSNARLPARAPCLSPRFDGARALKGPETPRARDGRTEAPTCRSNPVSDYIERRRRGSFYTQIRRRGCPGRRTFVLHCKFVLSFSPPPSFSCTRKYARLHAQNK